MSLTPQWLDELRSRISLSGVIGRSVRVTKAGREFKACCPFHNEKTPSFTINDEKGFYHCFGCGAHGDVIRWMTDHQGLPFMDAVKELALQAGMEVPAPDPRAAKKAEQQKSLHDVMQAAQDFFVRCLAEDRGSEARRYLASRGFPAQIVRDFGFGFAPDSRTALKEALSAFPDEMLIEAGLRIVVEGKEPYDRFRGRLMLPILDPRGRVIAFGGRILTAEKTDAPKYLNSPDTPLFDKGRTVYNLHRAGPASRQNGRVVVVEGYMDVVALAAAGIGEAVAPLGTALTEHQIERLWRLVETPTLCFDGDSAGQRAAMRASSCSKASTSTASAPPCARSPAPCPCCAPAIPCALSPCQPAWTRTMSSRSKAPQRWNSFSPKRAVWSMSCGKPNATLRPSPLPKTRQASRHGCSRIARRSSTPTSSRSTAAS